MAYRSSHFRRGYYRKTPSGGYTWVSPTTVSGYEYSPGFPTYIGRIPNITYTDNQRPINGFDIRTEKTTIETIYGLFQTLDSEERKYCLDLLEILDIQLDEEITETNTIAEVYEDSIPESDPSLFMTEPYEDGLCIAKFIGFDETVIKIPASISGKPILALGTRAFAQVTSLTTLIMPDTIISIGAGCFCLCRNLQKMKLSNSIKFIGGQAFACTKIEEIEMPDSVISISTGCFRESSLRNIKLSTSLTQIGAYSFFRCSELKSISIPNNVRSISEYAFSLCVSLQNVILPSMLEYIGDHAFENCSSLKSIDIPPSVKTIESLAFAAGRFRWLDIVIKCKPGSIAQQYARDLGIKAVATQIVYKGERTDIPD